MTGESNFQINRDAYKLRKQQRERAQTAARLGSDFVVAVRNNLAAEVELLLAENSPARLAFDMFGTLLFRLDLRLADPQEAGKLAPYDLQIDPQMALLELAVLEPLEQGEGHVKRLFGSSLLLQPSAVTAYGWLILDVIPVNSDGTFSEDAETDQRILAVHQGREILPLQAERLSLIEHKFLSEMQGQNGRFNLEELYNALRLWRGYTALVSAEQATPNAWAAAVEYLITLFDYFEVNEDDLAHRYQVSQDILSNCYQEIAQVLKVTQFDDRYSIHPDPVAHYKTLFDDIGIDYRSKKQVRDDLLQGGMFNSVAPIPDDDEDFFGPGGN